MAKNNLEFAKQKTRKYQGDYFEKRVTVVFRQIKMNYHQKTVYPCKKQEFKIYMTNLPKVSRNVPGQGIV